MSDLNTLLDVAEKLEESGFIVEADLIDDYVDQLTKIAKQGIHKCGLKESSIDDHLTLLDDYKKASSHFDSEYKKALKSGNEKDSPNYGKLREIASSCAYNYNAITFHEMYMSDVVTNNPYPIEKDSQMVALLKQYYGDYNSLVQELQRLVLIPRNGWVILSYCTIKKELFFNVVDLHHENVVASGIPVLALDVWEHAYLPDFGLDKEAYLKWFLGRLDWRNIRKRIKNITRMK